MRKVRIADSILKFLIIGSSLISIGALLWIVGYIVINGLPHITWEFISTEYKGDQTGILPMIISTAYIIGLSLLISVPIGICSAIYLVEYSKPGNLIRCIRFATESLAGIPSIIYGLFGYIFFVTALKLRMSILSGSITLSIMILPLIIRTTEEALKAVPNSYREGSFALGASKLTTITRIILPSAIQGILTAVILSVGRIVGETAALYLTAGMVTRIPDDIMSSGRSLSVHLYMLAKEGISFEQAFATATVLLIIVAVINFIANMLASRIKKATTAR